MHQTQAASLKLSAALHLSGPVKRLPATELAWHMQPQVRGQRLCVCETAVNNIMQEVHAICILLPAGAQRSVFGGICAWNGQLKPRIFITKPTPISPQALNNTATAETA